MRTFDVRAWVVWLVCGGLLSIRISNPLYLVLLLFIARLVYFSCRQVESDILRLPFWRISLVILVFSTFFNMLTAHVGRTVIYNLPVAWPLIGGPLTLEAGIYGFINGLRLITLLSFFLAFNAIVPVTQLATLTPRALHELGLVMLIAITYIPETARQFQRIKDAQAIRGHQLGGLRTWRPILIPLLIAGLERALNLAETMVARGYGSTTHIAVPLRFRLMMLAGLMLILSGAIWLVWAGTNGWILLVAGTLVIVWAYYGLSRLATRTRYRQRRWALPDNIIIIVSLFSLAPLLPMALLDRSTLAYAPYPSLYLPPFDLLIGLTLLGLAAPALLVTMISSPLEAFE